MKPSRYIHYYPEVSYGFVKQLQNGSISPAVYDSPDPDPNPRLSLEENIHHCLRSTESLQASPSPGELVLVVLHFKLFSSEPFRYDMVCIDGDQGVIKCRLDNELSRSFHDGQPSAGSTVTLQSYTVMRMKPHEGQKRCYLYVTEFDWKPSPREERIFSNGADCQQYYVTTMVDQELITAVMDKTVIITAENTQVDYLAPSVLSLPEPSLERKQEDCDKSNSAKKVINNNCGCFYFSFDSCVAQCIPLDYFRDRKAHLWYLIRRINKSPTLKEYLADVDQKRLVAENDSASLDCPPRDQWDDLPPKLQRCIIFWSYAVDVYRCDPAYPELLPQCFQLSARNWTPDTTVDKPSLNF